MESLDVAEQLKTEINKKLISLKQPNNDGLILNIHQTSSTRSTRFIHGDFQSNGNILALANNDAQIYIFDFLVRKYWTLQKLDSCTCIKLSECNEGHILVGKANGILDVLNIDSGIVVAKLVGHEHAVISISFIQSNMCLSASKKEALIWDLCSFSKIQVLSLEKECALKFVHFVPISNHILICYQDDIIQIWQNGSFKSLKQFHPSNWRNYSVRSITFSKNGKVMIVSGYLPVLAVFQLDIWKLLKVINLPEYINTVKKIQFIPQNFDGGSNKLLALLSGNGIIYFYNIEENILISELRSKCEIIKFHMSSSNVTYISCLLSTGEVEIYDISYYTMKNELTIVEKAQQIYGGTGLKPKLKNFRRKGDLNAKKQMAEILEIDKLKGIIKEYQEFPEAFRASIWERVLALPNNIQQYNNIVNHVTIAAFRDLYRHFPLEDKVAIRCLRHVLNNIVTWCPFFGHVTFLPFFLFPFVKVFHKKSVACFEICCTIIINWCQHWFEYHPLPPVNVLAIIDNILMEHDADLLKYFAKCNIKSIVYSWSILETAFSEVLAADQWLQLWDHTFINEPAFFLCATVAFNIIQKKQLMLISKEDEFNKFFHSQHPLDVKKLIRKTYYICTNTSETNHPRQYLNMFTCLTPGAYPIFDQYPEDVVNFETEHVNFIDNQLGEINNLKKNLIREQIRQSSQSTYNDVDIQNEENRRMIEVEKACIQKIKSYQEALKAQQEQLKAMRMDLIDQEKTILTNTQKNLNRQTTNANAGNMEILMEGLDMSERINETELTKLEEIHQKQRVELLRKEQILNEHLKAEGPSPELARELLFAQRNTEELKDQIKMAQMDFKYPRKANVAIAISTMNKLMDKIKLELEKERDSTNYGSVKEKLKVHQLEKETKALQKEVSQLLRLFSGNQEGSSSWSTQDCNCDVATCTATNKTVRFNTSEY